MAWRAAVAGLEAAMALCAALNLAYFVHRMLSPETLSRRVAAFVLALLSLGALVESAFILVSLSAASEGPIFASASWALVRAPAYAGTACISLLVARALGNGR